MESSLQVNFASEVSASDIIDTSPDITCTPASGTFFTASTTGQTTTVNCTAKDESGNESSKSFKIAVVKTTTPPTDSTPTINVSATKTTITTKESTKLTATVSGGDGKKTISWSCSNGKTGGNTSTFTFSSTKAGTFTCTAKVRDNDGDEATKSVSIVVKAVTATTTITPTTNTTTPQTEETTTETEDSGEVLSVDDTNAANDSTETEETQPVVTAQPTFLQQYGWALALLVIGLVGSMTAAFFIVKNRSKKSEQVKVAK